MKIAASILAGDFTQLGRTVQTFDQAGCDSLHLDVMDGHFVPNISFGTMMVSALRPLTGKPFDVHLMISPLGSAIEGFASAGADTLIIHAEAEPHLDRALDSIRRLGKRAGLALNPGTSPAQVEFLLDRLDVILVMSVNPGYGGQEFIRSQLEKVVYLRRMITGRGIQLEVDGGVNTTNAGELAAAGATGLIAGNALFTGTNMAAQIAKLKEAGEIAGASGLVAGNALLTGTSMAAQIAKLKPKEAAETAAA